MAVYTIVAAENKSFVDTTHWPSRAAHKSHTYVVTAKNLEKVGTCREREPFRCL